MTIARQRLTIGRRVQVISPAPRAAWAAVYEADPSALVTQSPQWIDAMIDEGYVDASRWYALPDGRDIVLPMARRRLGGGAGVHSSFGEGWGMGGPIAPDGVTESDAAVVARDLAGLAGVQTTVRINPLAAEAWAAVPTPIRTPRFAHVLDLAGGADIVWADRMSSGARRGVRKAQKLGVEVTCDTSGAEVGVFYDMLLQSFERWGRRQNEPAWLARFRGRRRDPLRKFESLARRLGEGFRLYVARHDGVPAAAILVLAGHNSQYTRGAMDVDVGGRTNANDLLHWTAIQDACADGSRSYHMGESAPGSSLARYKEKLGAAAVAYPGIRWERLPMSKVDAAARSTVKRLIGFKDA